MTTYRVVVEVKVREYYILEAQDEEQAEAMALSGSVTPARAEPAPGTEEVTEIEEVE